MYEVLNIILTKPIPKIEQKLHWFWKISKLSKNPKKLGQTYEMHDEERD